MLFIYVFLWRRRSPNQIKFVSHDGRVIRTNLVLPHLWENGEKVVPHAIIHNFPQEVSLLSVSVFI